MGSARPKMSDNGDPVEFAHHMIAADGFEKAREVAIARMMFWQQVVAIINDERSRFDRPGHALGH
jgi:hypothetical protein